MRRRTWNSWLIVAALLLAGWLLWSRLHLVFVVQLNVWTFLLIFGLIALLIYVVLRRLAAP